MNLNSGTDILLCSAYRCPLPNHIQGLSSNSLKPNRSSHATAKVICDFYVVSGFPGLTNGCQGNKTYMPLTWFLPFPLAICPLLPGIYFVGISFMLCYLYVFLWLGKKGFFSLTVISITIWIYQSLKLLIQIKHFAVQQYDTTRWR